jgi:hypothetical protein
MLWLIVLYGIFLIGLARILSLLVRFTACGCGNKALSLPYPCYPVVDHSSENSGFFLVWSICLLRVQNSVFSHDKCCASIHRGGFNERIGWVSLY